MRGVSYLDTLIQNGDFAPDPSKMPIKISGEDEVKQRIYIRLKAKRGSFLYDRNFGSRFYELAECYDGQSLKSAVKEALDGTNYAEVISAENTENGFLITFERKGKRFDIVIPKEE